MSPEHSTQRAIFSINISMAAFVVGDVFLKLLGQSYPAGEVIFWRSCIITGALGVFLITRGKTSLRRIISVPVLARSAFDCINIFTFVSAVVHLNIAELYAILLMSPFLMTILAVLLFKEPVGWRRWLTISLGFVGVLFIIKPNARAFDYWAAIGFVSALSAALRELVTQKIDPAASTIEVTLTSAVIATIVALLFGLGESWKPVNAYDSVLLVVLTGSWATAVFLLIYACRVGPLVTVASFRYMLLVWGGLASYFIFGDIPDLWSILGAIVIVLCGLYMFHREAVHRRTLASRLTGHE